ncbi:hypothetical protein ACFVIM_15985 [Streptomyces sp. NPDC057638]|uniref:hypothetical protein n=1 Tax=Streptomyces sp. NPDC057638 TaxID=3346190 RepID=UPI003699813A
MRARRLVLVPFLAVLMAVGGLGVLSPGVPTASAAPVSAAPRAGTPVSSAAMCSGRLAKVVSFSTGQLRVYKSRTSACAMTVAARPGPRRAMSVSIQPRGGHARAESGRFTRYAGPVTVHALNRCVRASGKVAGGGGSTGWILC